MSVAEARPGIRLLLVDDHRIFAEALAARLLANEYVDDVELAFTAAEVYPKVRATSPSLVLVDVALGDESGIDVATNLTAEFPGLPIVMVSAVTDTSEVVKALTAGAKGWIPKHVSIDEFLAAVDEVLIGQMWVPPRMLSDVLESLLETQVGGGRQRSFAEELSPRQQEILSCLAEGMSRPEIAARMGISHNTVRTHIQALLKKADVHSTVALLARARAVGFPDDGVRPRV